jgi:diadenylate cyclase
MSIEKETGMSDYIETGISLNSMISSELLINIFIPNTPLHDGAVIIQKNQIAAAACYLPLSESPFISKELGTRHRAALGISEVTDSLTIIVSEETGSVSVARNSELHRNLTQDELREILQKELIIITKPVSSNRWQWRGKNNG